MYIRFNLVNRVATFELPQIRRLKQITIQRHLYLSKNVYFVLRHQCFIHLIINAHHIAIKSQISDIKWQNICTSFNDLKTFSKFTFNYVDLCYVTNYIFPK